METKQERLQLTINSLIDKIEIPSYLKMMLPNLLGQLTTSLHQLSDEDIDNLVGEIRHKLDFVQNGHLPFEDCVCDDCEHTR